MLNHSSIVATTRSLLMALLLAAIATPAAGQPTGTVQIQSNRPAAALSDPFTLAVHYENGESVSQDYRRALALYCKAARSGDARAYFNLGWMYLNGRGMPPNDRAADYWLRRAASRGMTQAQNLLRLLSGVEPADPGCSRGRAWPVAAALGGLRTHPPVAAPAIRAAIDEVADAADLDDRLLVAVVTVESGFQPAVVSPKGAMGLMQLMPETAARFGVHDPFDYRENLRGGAAYLNWLLRKFDGNLPLALAAYNAGEDTVTAYGGVPPFPETAAYIEEVQRLCRCTTASFQAQRRGTR